MKLIVGLGNPGWRYVHNRHNAGFMCLGYFARRQGIKLDKKHGKARTGSGDVAGHRVVLVRPQTYMNLSGKSVSLLVKRFNISSDNLLVIHDDLDLSPGKIRIRLGSSSGGHKGIDSIITHLGSQDFHRIRVGIGRPALLEDSAKDKEAEIVAYVLSDFAPEEKDIMTRAIHEVSQAIICLLREGLTAATNKYN